MRLLDRIDGYYDAGSGNSGAVKAAHKPPIKAAGPVPT